MAIKDTRERDAIRNQLEEGIQTFSVYDANGRIIQFFEATTDAVQDAPCLLTEFKYVDGPAPAGTSHVVLASKETVALWDAATYDFDGLP